MDEIIHFFVKGDSMFPTFKNGDIIDMIKFNNNIDVSIDDIVVFDHPFKKDCRLIKRIKKITKDNKIFVQGDNKSYNHTSDSHNFGHIKTENLIAIRKKKNEFTSS
tara:strand:+ start:976 stop:1293 length:318 start_codon:yes stop_codon:yes gene_type:complete